MNQSRIDLTSTQWLSEEESCKLLKIKIKTLREYCQSGKYTYRVRKINGKTKYFLNVKSMPDKVIAELQNYCNPKDNFYSEAPSWAKIQAERYVQIIKNCQHLRGAELQDYISKWNLLHPENQTSYPSIIRMRRRYYADGISGLLSQKGRINRTTVPDKYFEYFKTLYLTEGAPSLRSCWDLTLGYAIRTDNIAIKDFPTPASFLRRLERDVLKQSIYLARYGDSAWNRKYGNYIDRDYSNIVCGKVWVSDHAQIDIACMTKEGDVVFPWVTAWRDYKSGKWLGWLLQSGNPNSDHIFQTFYYAAERFGLPEDVIIDNGKDYRCKDFAGGRRVIKIETNKSKTTSMLDELNVDVHFALPYNAQTKPIERDFLKIKELLSKHCIGYRGGNVVERPEKLSREIKEGKILQFDDFKKIFDDFVINVLNKKPSQGKNLNGLAPDELFNQEAKEKITTSKDALKLFCMRTSRNYTICRNGIKDREVGITYWADWMISNMGLKVYLRRDIQDYTVAWAFRLDNEEFIGKVKAVKAVAALYADKISKEEFKEAMSIKKRNLKVAKSYIKQTQNIPLEEQYENYKYAYNSMIKASKYNPKITRLANTKMDQAIKKAKEMELVGKQNLGMFIDDTSKIVKNKDLYLFETDKILEEELKEVAYGY